MLSLSLSLSKNQRGRGNCLNKKEEEEGVGLRVEGEEIIEIMIIISIENTTVLSNAVSSPPPASPPLA